MNNLLKVSTLFFAVVLSSCESKPATTTDETANTEAGTVETTAPAATDSAAATTAPMDAATPTDGTAPATTEAGASSATTAEKK